MYVKRTFLYETIKEEVYVCQPPGFEDPNYLDKVYKVVKALYGLHQAPRAWYETLANYLLENGFQKGKIDQTLFIKKHKGDILLVQVYVDEIIFGSTNKELCTAFEKLMKDKFQMSSMGELTFFLGLQVKQKEDGIFISQDKYVAEILRKFGFTYVKSASTTIETEKPLLKDPNGEDVDVYLYRSMIGSLMYLTSSRPHIMFAVCACARFQVTPKVSHLHAVKRIFRYLKGKPYLGLWYLRDSPFNLVAYSNSDYTGASLNRKSTKRGCQFLVLLEAQQISNDSPLLGVNTPRCDKDSIELKELMVFIVPICVLRKMDWSYCWSQVNVVEVEKVNGDVHLQALIDDRKVVVTETIIRQDLHLDDADGVKCLPNAESFKELARMEYEKPPPKLTFYKAFFSVQWKFLIHTIVQCISAKRTAWNKFSSSMASAVICLATDHQVDDMTTHNPRYKSPALTQKVFANMMRARKGFSGVETPLFDSMMDASKQVEIAAIDADEGTNLVDEETDEEEVALDAESQGRTNLKTKVLLVKENVNAASNGVSAVIAPELVSTAEPTVFDNEDVTMIMAQTLIKMKAKKARILDEKIAQKLHELQRQLDEREDDIDWSVVAEQVKERQLDLIKRYQDLKKKPVSVAQARKNMMIYLKNMAGYKMEFFKGMIYDEIRPIFERHFKKLRAAEVSGSESTQEIPTDDPKEITEEDVQNMFEIVLVPKFRIEALQRLYSDCGVHHVSSTRGHDIYKLTEKDYPLLNAVMILMLSGKLQVEEDNEMARDLVIKIFMEANRSRKRSA
nr:uncharacterized mitochondrial protein AtMg00810-like [Tanacetum cinerariifolium]